MELIKITLEKSDEIINLYKDAIIKMEKSGIFQWDEKYPDENDLKSDIIKEQMYGILINNEIVSTFVINKEFDKEYLYGNWKYKGNNYVILHRICVKANYQNKRIGTNTMITMENHLKKII